MSPNKLFSVTLNSFSFTTHSFWFFARGRKSRRVIEKRVLLPVVEMLPVQDELDSGKIQNLIT